MRIINISKSTNEESFKYSIFISLYYYDILCHPERITKFKPIQNKYNFTHNTPNEFELDKPSISLTIFDEDNKIIYFANNNSDNEAQIVKINKYRYAGIKPSKDYFIKLKQLLKH